LDVVELKEREPRSRIIVIINDHQEGMNGCWGLSFFLSTARKDGRQKWVAAENHHQHHHHFFSQPASQPATCLPDSSSS
jgi:hypothetical protein